MHHAGGRKIANSPTTVVWEVSPQVCDVGGEWEPPSRAQILQYRS